MLSFRQSLFALGSLCLSTAVVGNAYLQKRQFYPSVVFLTKSNPCMAVIYVQAAVIVWLVAKAMGKLFFGQLRPAEIEHLLERSWYAVTETCLAFTVFRDDFSPKFIALFVLLLVLKGFHWLAEDRVDFMERSPNISLLFHVRVLSLLALLSLLDYAFVRHAYSSVAANGASVQVVFGFEYAILLSSVLYILIKYVLHSIDSRAETQWENKAVLLLYTELMMSSSKVLLYATFMVVMLRIHTFPLFAIRPMYLSIRALKRAFKDVVLSRQAINNMNTLYPDATAEELASADNVCIICREEMQVTGAVGGAGANKKLPCNHIFHAACLRSWFQRQQTCPTCRSDVLNVGGRAAAANAPAGDAAGGQRPALNVVPGLNIPGAPGALNLQLPNLPAFFANWPNLNQPFNLNNNPVQPQPQQQQQQPQTPANNNNNDNNNARGNPAAGGSAGTAGPPGGESGAPPPSGAAGSGPSSASGPSGTATGSGTGVGAAAAPAPGQAASSTPSTVVPPPPPFTLLPAMFLPPPPPIIPAGLNLGSLSEAELRAMEGNERRAVEARIQNLRNIQILLDAAVTMMTQYNSVVGITTATANAAAATVVAGPAGGGGSTAATTPSGTVPPPPSSSTGATASSSAPPPSQVVASGSGLGGTSSNNNNNTIINNNDSNNNTSCTSSSAQPSAPITTTASAVSSMDARQSAPTSSCSSNINTAPPATTAETVPVDRVTLGEEACVSAPSSSGDPTATSGAIDANELRRRRVEKLVGAVSGTISNGGAPATSHSGSPTPGTPSS